VQHGERIGGFGNEDPSAGGERDLGRSQGRKVSDVGRRRGPGGSVY